MRIEIKTDGVRFRAGGPAKPKQDYRDKSKQAVTPRKLRTILWFLRGHGDAGFCPRQEQHPRGLSYPGQAAQLPTSRSEHRQENPS